VPRCAAQSTRRVSRRPARICRHCAVRRVRGAK
jgi:hypothetical protein